jgi:hypothetical protein
MTTARKFELQRSRERPTTVRSRVHERRALDIGLAALRACSGQGGSCFPQHVVERDRARRSFVRALGGASPPSDGVQMREAIATAGKDDANSRSQSRQSTSPSKRVGFAHSTHSRPTSTKSSAISRRLRPVTTGRPGDGVCVEAGRQLRASARPPDRRRRGVRPERKGYHTPHRHGAQPSGLRSKPASPARTTSARARRPQPLASAHNDDLSGPNNNRICGARARGETRRSAQGIEPTAAALTLDSP